MHGNNKSIHKNKLSIFDFAACKIWNALYICFAHYKINNIHFNFEHMLLFCCEVYVLYFNKTKILMLPKYYKKTEATYK